MGGFRQTVGNVSNLYLHTLSPSMHVIGAEYRVHSILSMFVTCTKSHPGDWEQHIKKVCLAYDVSIHPSTGFLPF